MSPKRARVTGWAVGLAAAATMAAYGGLTHQRTEAKIAYVDTAEHAMHAGQFAEAAEAYRQALRIDPRYLPARTGLADVYCSTGEVEKALDEHRRACELAPRNSQAHVERANMCIGYHRYAEAIEALEQAVILTPQDAHARLLLASAYRWNEELEKARAQLAEVEKVEPGSLAVERARRAMRKAERARAEAAKPANAQAGSATR